MQKFKVTGMSCAACSARVEKAVNSVDGTRDVTVNLLTGDLCVSGDAKAAEIKAAVIAAGYGITDSEGAEAFKNNELRTVKKRLTVSVCLLLVIMYFSMFRMLFGFPIPSFFIKNPAALGVLELTLTLAVCIINRNFFINGVKGIFNKAPNMDTLVSLGASASFLWSLYIVIAEITGKTPQNTYLYFESAAMILTLITVGKMLEEKAKVKTSDAVSSLKKLFPETATLLKDGKEIKISAEKLKAGDIFIVKAGESIPADAVIIEGSASVDESFVTGESIPVLKSVGDSIIGVTVSRNGVLICRTTAAGGESTFSEILKTVADASATKAPIARLADKVAGVFVPAVILIAAVTLIIWLMLGKSGGYALSRAISVLVISCPCALGLATPVAITAASGVGAKYGVLYKNAAVLEMCGKINTVILDKTGTVTKGVPCVTDVFSSDKEKLLTVAAALEKNSSHPLSNAVCEYTSAITSLPIVSDFKEVAGVGVYGKADGIGCFGGSVTAARQKADLSSDAEQFIKKTELEGKTPLVFLCDDKLLGIIAVADTVKEDSAFAISQLKRLGIEVIMLSGDNAVTADAIAEKVGIKKVIAGVMPDGKAEKVKEYMKKSRVAMVGDGINDAPALSTADVGIAIGGSKDIACESADVILLGSELSAVVTALTLGKKALANIKENLFWAFIYNIIGIPLAAGVFSSLLGFDLNPMFSAAAMSLSSFCVVSNALRLNLFKPTVKTEEKNMEKTLKITGMMCPHCEAHVKTALEGIDGVITAVPSHEKNEAVVTLSKNVDNALLKKAVEDAGYTLTDIK